MAVISGSDQFQNAVYVGVNLEGILYGVELVLYFMTMHKLLTHDGKRTKSDVFYAVFSSIMLLNATIWVATQANFGQHMWLVNANFPGGPNAYWDAHISNWSMELGTAAMVVLQLMTDGLMIYRCWMVWNSYRVIILPSIVWMGTLALGITVVWFNSTKGGVEFQGIASRFCLAYFSIATSLTTILTSMICYRILSFGRKLNTYLGYEYALPYFAVLSLVVESVLPYTLTGITFLVTFGIGAQILNAVAYTHTLMMCISPQMLILRVATGAAWAQKTCKQPHSTIKFAPQSMTTGTGSELTEILTIPELTMCSTRERDDSV